MLSPSLMTRTPLPHRVIAVADGFWNIRGSFRIGPLDVGTQASLVRRANGSFVLLDACAFDDATLAWMREVTGDGERLEATIHLHPFHTLHVRAAHQKFPSAVLYGTARHVEKFADLPWAEPRTESSAFHALYASDFEFSVPRGVDFIPAEPKLHFSSVLAFHPSSRTLHVDDTLMYVKLPWPLRIFKPDIVGLHPTLAKVLEPRPGAVDEFRTWARQLVERLENIDNLCAAHMGALLSAKRSGASLASRVGHAVRRAERTLRAHERRYPGSPADR